VNPAAPSRKPAAVLAALALLAAMPAAALEAAFGKVDITPDLAAEKVLMAGFGAVGRKPQGVHDPLHARFVLLREGTTTVALVSLDLLGFYLNETADLRRRSGFDAPGRYLFVHATHQHSGPDTLGLWGPFPGVSGVDHGYQTRIKEAIAAALRDAESRLVKVAAAGGAGRLDPRGLCRDSRDPQVIDPHLSVLRLKDGKGKAVATVVNWSCHPEVLGRENKLLTADYPGVLCSQVEERTGGGCVFLNGMIGGLMTPDVKAESYAEMERVGRALADAALRLPLAPAAGRPLAARSESVLVPVENSRYRLFLPALTFGHDLLDASGTPLPSWKRWWLPLKHALARLSDRDQPWVRSEVSLVDVGPARLLGLPAEMFPETVLGGYDGRFAYGRPVTTPGNPLPPDLAAAPGGPYLREKVKAPVPMLVGLANDELGYVLPAYDFKAAPTLSMTPRPLGHHYEETNSIGPSATSILLGAASRLLERNP
jgi:hypothetical protein